MTARRCREVIVELERMRAAAPTVDELSLGTTYLDGVFPIRYETTDAIAARSRTSARPAARRLLRHVPRPNPRRDGRRRRAGGAKPPAPRPAAGPGRGRSRQVEPTLADLELGPIDVIGDDDE